jgi:hypothetical protein
MWIVLNNAFLSIVQDPDKPDTDDLLVRGRIRGDIQRVFPDADVIELVNRDYAYRAWIPRKEVANAIRESILGIDYGNFKGSVTEYSRHSVYSRIWGVLHGFQWELKGRSIAQLEAQRQVEWLNRQSQSSGQGRLDDWDTIEEDHRE